MTFVVRWWLRNRRRPTRAERVLHQPGNCQGPTRQAALPKLTLARRRCLPSSPALRYPTLLPATRLQAPRLPTLTPEAAVPGQQSSAPQQHGAAPLPNHGCFPQRAALGSSSPAQPAPCSQPPTPRGQFGAAQQSSATLARRTCGTPGQQRPAAAGARRSSPATHLILPPVAAASDCCQWLLPVTAASGCCQWLRMSGL